MEQHLFELLLEVLLGHSADLSELRQCFYESPFVISLAESPEFKLVVRTICNQNIFL